MFAVATLGASNCQLGGGGADIVHASIVSYVPLFSCYLPRASFNKISLLQYMPALTVCTASSGSFQVTVADMYCADRGHILSTKAESYDPWVEPM